MEPVFADAAYGAAVAAARDFFNGSGTGAPNFSRVPVPVNAQGDHEEGSSVVNSFPRDYRNNGREVGELGNQSDCPCTALLGKYLVNITNENINLAQEIEPF